MYESGPVSIRASYNWRSSYVSAANLADAGSIQPPTAHTKAYGELGLSADYAWSDHLTFTVDVSNVLDSIYQDHFGEDAFASVYPRDTRHYDRVYQVGLRYRM
jgi:outer membrane receptor protein involved in Fe transport